MKTQYNKNLDIVLNNIEDCICPHIQIKGMQFHHWEEDDAAVLTMFAHHGATRREIEDLRDFLSGCLERSELIEAEVA